MKKFTNDNVVVTTPPPRDPAAVTGIWRPDAAGASDSRDSRQGRTGGRQSASTGSAGKPEPRLRLQAVSVELSRQPIVSGVSLSIAKGDIACLVGPSGCGKTTLLRAIAGFESPCSGTIEVDGKEVAGPSCYLPAETRNIGMVFQDLALFPHMSVRKNVGFGMRGRSRREVRERVDELLDLVALSDYADSQPHELSGGQQQRVALIRAMAPRPDLLLLDEPFSSQDTELRVQLAHEVRNILKRDGITAILVTHDQHEAFAIADRIGVMSCGQLRQWDTAFNLYHLSLIHI